MTSRITVIDGHPDPDRARFCHALADAYSAGAAGGGHAIERLTLSEMEIPLLRTAHEWEQPPAAVILRHQEAIARAQHLVIIYPLWLGTMPALLKAFLEQVFRPGFAIRSEPGKMWTKLLKGKSARVVVTMGMPGSSIAGISEPMG